MRRTLVLLALAAGAASCVSVGQLPDAKGALKSGQRLVVLVNQSPGPWIVDSGDSKLESAAKISPVGFLVQNVQDEHALKVSQDLQQYLPRPQYWLEVQNALFKSLKAGVPGHALQTGIEAGVAPAQLYEWNKAKDQLDWRQRYYAIDATQPPPRDYARALVLDDALILDVNLSFGTDSVGEGDQARVVPALTADSRVYAGDTSRLIWEHEDEATDQTSSMTVAEFKLQPWELTKRLEALAPALGATIAGSFAKSFGFAAPAAPAVAASSGTARGGLVPMSFFPNASSGTPSGFGPAPGNIPPPGFAPPPPGFAPPPAFAPPPSFAAPPAGSTAPGR